MRLSRKWFYKKGWGNFAFKNDLFSYIISNKKNACFKIKFVGVETEVPEPNPLMKNKVSASDILNLPFKNICRLRSHQIRVLLFTAKPYFARDSSKWLCLPEKKEKNILLFKYTVKK